MSCRCRFVLCFGLAWLAGRAIAQDELLARVAELPMAPELSREGDWLLDPTPFRAGLYRGEDPRELVLTNGLVRRVFRVSPNGATIDLCRGPLEESLLRSVRPEARVQIDGAWYDVGGLVGQTDHAYLDAASRDSLRADPAALRLVSFRTGPIEPRLEWAQVRHHAPDAVWPPAGISVAFEYALPDGGPNAVQAESSPRTPFRVTVHYELYDGLPLFGKWIRVHDDGTEALTVDRFVAEIVAAVEAESRVETRDGVPYPTPLLHVETDYAFGGMCNEDANRFAVHWREDPLYDTQVNYLRKTPCLLEVGPEVGPAQTVAPGESFPSFHVFTLLPDPIDTVRRDLAQRKMMRTLAPWVTENPLMMHVRSAEPDAVREAISQCATVGFEMVILTFGSGFDVEDESLENLERWRDLAAFARERGIELGGYSLLASRRISPDTDNCLHPDTGQPGGQTFGFAPALASGWGQDYFRKLTHFYEFTDFRLLEHDGSYPGDLDACARPPLQKGVLDSRWVQWRTITDFYRACRARGVFLNVPDYYYLSGSNKCAMGYRETNWSLPREQQQLHTRQNLYDGTREKTPSMGWMFVPLTEYHGGGAAATIEPLAEHLDHYRSMLLSNLAYGAQACYRGPRLYDTPATRDMVRECVDWFLRYRDILEADVIHSSSRRADGRGLDWVFHAHPGLEQKGMLVVFNPLDRPVTRTIPLDLRATGLLSVARVRPFGGRAESHDIGRDHSIALTVEVPARGMSWYLVE